MMRRALLAVLLGLVAVLSPALPAAADAGAPITDLAIDVQLRANPPASLLGDPVAVRDLSEGADGLPPTDAIELTGDRVHVVARPSGTEPKLKCYLEIRMPASEDVRAQRDEDRHLIQQLREEMAMSLGIEA